MSMYDVNFANVKDAFAPISHYISPITQITGEITSEIIKDREDHLIATVNQTVGYQIDREELLKALQYDRDQYRKGYEAAHDEFQKKAMDALAQISLEECTSDNPQYKKAMNKALNIIKDIWLNEEN